MSNYDYGYCIVNSSGSDSIYGQRRGVNYYDTSAVAIESGIGQNQPKVVGGQIHINGSNVSSGIKTMNFISQGLAAGIQRSGNPVFWKSHRDLSTVKISGLVLATQGVQSGDNASWITPDDITTFAIGQKMYIGPSGSGNVAVAGGSGANVMYGVQTVSLVNAEVGGKCFTTDRPFVDMGAANTKQVVCQFLNTSFKINEKPTAGVVTMINGTNNIGGAYDTSLRGPTNTPSQDGIDIHQSINKRQGYRTTKTTTLLRNNGFSRYLGRFTAIPELSDDYSATDAGGNTSDDHAANVTPRADTVPGELVIKSGRPKAFGTGDGMTYTAKTG